VVLNSRAGSYVKQPAGFRAFIPADLPPDPPIAIDAEFLDLLSKAERNLGRLDGATSILPNPDLFVTMYVRQEAVLSSQIEGTQSTLQDVLLFEIDKTRTTGPGPADTEEVINYVASMNYGLKRMSELPISLRLIREMHGILLEGVRGSEKTPGEFRRSQNWIGGSMPSNATFVPPPVTEMMRALHNFEKFLHDTSLPTLIHCGLAHAQFETIHPFQDGNGRIGRLLITFLLCQRGVLHRPLLYLSHYFKLHRSEYYDRLMDVRNSGSWETWLKFFLRGVCEVSEQATQSARAIVAMREQHRALITEKLSNATYGIRLLDRLFEQPIITVPHAEKLLQCTYLTANRLLDQLEKLHIVDEITGGKRNRKFAYTAYLLQFSELDRPVETPGEDTSTEV